MRGGGCASTLQQFAFQSDSYVTDTSVLRNVVLIMERLNSSSNHSLHCTRQDGSGVSFCCGPRNIIAGDWNVLIILGKSGKKIAFFFTVMDGQSWKPFRTCNFLLVCLREAGREGMTYNSSCSTERYE